LSKLNCWEVKKCGREPNGAKVDELGACPASTKKGLDGVHDGQNAGRACWVVAGSMCNGKKQGTFAKKFANCNMCDFYSMVKLEEGLNLEMSVVLLNKLRHAEAMFT
jgi:hypothetical protein